MQVWCLRRASPGVMTVEERSGPLGQPYSRDELWAESHHVGLALENGPIDRLRRDVDRLAVEIGPRNIYHYEALQKAADHLETSLRETGYSPLLHRYETHDKAFFNISAELPGRERSAATRRRSGASGCRLGACSCRGEATSWSW